MYPGSHELRWRDLAKGVLLLATMLFSAIVILTQVGLGNIPGEKFTIFARTEQARGILNGSDVWVAGTRVGSVSNIQFLPPDPQAVSSNRILLKLSILAAHREQIRGDAWAEVRPGTRLIGYPVLEISQGSPGEPPIADADTIDTIRQLDVERIAGRAEEALAALPPALAELQRVLVDARAIQTKYWSLLKPADSTSPASPLMRFLASLEDVVRRYEGGPLGAMTRDSSLAIRFRTAAATLDSAVRLLDLQESAAGRYLRDSRLPSRMDSTMTRFASVLGAVDARVADYRTGARAMALSNEIQRLTASLKALQADARRHPFKYIVF